MAREILTGHFITGLKQANVLLRSKMDNLPEFISADPKGEKLMQYYLSLEGAFEKEANESAQQFNRLREKVAIIEKIVTAQQGYGGANIGEEVIVNRIIEDALTILLEFLESHEIKVTTKFSGTPQVIVQKTKFMHILINLLKNAKESILSEASDTQRLLISSAEIEDVVQIKISDSGCGISPENLPKLFAHGFTTKKNGHGFGLHSCKHYMQQMNGSIWAESEGKSKGATFILELPSISQSKPTETKTGRLSTRWTYVIYINNPRFKGYSFRERCRHVTEISNKLAPKKKGGGCYESGSKTRWNAASIFFRR